MPDLLAGTLQACVGPAAGIELHAFVQNLDRMPDLDAILAGDDVPVPEAIDLQYAIAAALVGRAIRARDTDQSKQVIGRVLDYGGLFPLREMGVMLVSDLYRAVGESIFSVPQFSAWAKSVGEVMLYE